MVFFSLCISLASSLCLHYIMYEDQMVINTDCMVQPITDTFLYILYVLAWSAVSWL